MIITVVFWMYQFTTNDQVVRFIYVQIIGCQRLNINDTKKEAQLWSCTWEVKQSSILQEGTDHINEDTLLCLASLLERFLPSGDHDGLCYLLINNIFVSRKLRRETNHVLKFPIQILSKCFNGLTSSQSLWWGKEWYSGHTCCVPRLWWAWEIHNMSKKEGFHYWRWKIDTDYR